MKMTRRAFIGGFAGLFVSRKHDAMVQRSAKLLDTFYVAGYRYYDGPRVESGFDRGTELRLVRDPFNNHDPLAIEVLLPSGEKLGYVPRDNNKMPAILLDSGVEVSARIREVRRNAPLWERVRIDVLSAFSGH